MKRPPEGGRCWISVRLFATHGIEIILDRADLARRNGALSGMVVGQVFLQPLLPARIFLVDDERQAQISNAKDADCQDGERGISENKRGHFHPKPLWK